MWLIYEPVKYVNGHVKLRVWVEENENNNQHKDKKDPNQGANGENIAQKENN